MLMQTNEQGWTPLHRAVNTEGLLIWRSRHAKAHTNKALFDLQRRRDIDWSSMWSVGFCIQKIKCSVVGRGRRQRRQKRTSGKYVCVEGIMGWSANRCPLCFRVQTHLVGAALQPPPRQMKCLISGKRLARFQRLRANTNAMLWV